MTMDHGTCNIDVGCSINIQRTDGECENIPRLFYVCMSKRAFLPLAAVAVAPSRTFLPLALGLPYFALRNSFLSFIPDYSFPFISASLFLS